MLKDQSFRSFLLRSSLKVLAWEAALVILAWLLFRQMTWLQQIQFGDLLFLIAIVLFLIAGAGMPGNPYSDSTEYWRGMPVFPVQLTEQEKRQQRLAEIIAERSFALRMGALGLLTILFAAGFSYLRP